MLKWAALILLTIPNFASAEPAPSINATTEIASVPASLSVGRGGFVFDNWQGPALPIWTYVPGGIDRANAPVAFIMHGNSRDPQRYREQWIDEAEDGGFIVVAPEFSNADFPRAWGYNLGAMFDRESGELRDESVWSYSAIEPIFDEIVARLGGSQTSYTIYGHSAGSQFVHRFMFMKPESRAKRVLAANAGWYTFADPEIEFPFGWGGIPLSENQLRAALAKDMVVLLGDEDNDPDHQSLNRSAGAMRQGEHRFARGRAFFDAGKAYAAERGWQFGWTLRTVTGVAHSNDGMAKGAFDLIE